MKKHGVLNSDIAKVLADMGHTDQITIGDCGLPIHSEVRKIDLSLKIGEPSFESVLDVVMEDMEVEKVMIASEIKENNRELYDRLLQDFTNRNIEIEYVSHEEFKRLTGNSKAIIRTGEATPYANLILQSGVIF